MTQGAVRLSRPRPRGRAKGSTSGTRTTSPVRIADLCSESSANDQRQGLGVRGRRVELYRLFNVGGVHRGRREAAGTPRGSRSGVHELFEASRRRDERRTAWPAALLDDRAHGVSRTARGQPRRFSREPGPARKCSRRRRPADRCRADVRAGWSRSTSGARNERQRRGRATARAADGSQRGREPAAERSEQVGRPAPTERLRTSKQSASAAPTAAGDVGGSPAASLLRLDLDAHRPQVGPGADDCVAEACRARRRLDLGQRAAGDHVGRVTRPGPGSPTGDSIHTRRAPGSGRQGARRDDVSPAARPGSEGDRRGTTRAVHRSSVSSPCAAAVGLGEHVSSTGPPSARRRGDVVVLRLRR